MNAIRGPSSVISHGCRCHTSQPACSVFASLRATRFHRTARSAGGPNEGPTSSDEKKPSPAAPVLREYKAWGVKVVESNESFPAGIEGEKDFWEGDNFTDFGNALEKYFLPGLLVIGVIIGSYAANTYNEGATVYVKPSTGPDALPIVVPADQVVAPPTKAK